MSRDYKPNSQKQRPANKGNNAFVTGLLVGIILGIGISMVVAIMITGGKSAFVKPDEPVESSHPVENSKSANSGDATVPSEKAENKPDPNRFDFYHILPGESQVTEQEIKQSKATEKKKPAAVENYFLQVGSFQTEAEADNLKAKLALLGLEAVVQTATVADKGVWHRVRVGPYDDVDQIDKARAELTSNGVKSTLIKIHSNVPDQ